MFVVVAGVCSARADLITIDKIHQESRVQGNVLDQNGEQRGYKRVFHSGAASQRPINLSAESLANSSMPTRQAAASASQTINSYMFTPTGNLVVDLIGATAGSLQNTAGAGDRASVFDFFCVSFTTFDSMRLSLSAQVSAVGNVEPAIPSTSGNKSISFALEKTGGSNAFTDLVLYDSGSLNETAVLPAGSYHLLVKSEYGVGEPAETFGNSYSGGTSFGVNMSVSAVPEPSGASLILAALGFASLRRRRST